MRRHGCRPDVPADKWAAEDGQGGDGDGGGTECEAHCVPEGSADPRVVSSGVSLRVCRPKGWEDGCLEDGGVSGETPGDRIGGDFGCSKVVGDDEVVGVEDDEAGDLEDEKAASGGDERADFGGRNRVRKREQPGLVPKVNP